MDIRTEFPAFKIKDIGLAELGRKKMRMAEKEMPGLMALREEFAMRQKHGFRVDWLDRAAVRARYGFATSAAILSRQAARVDPYRLAYKLLARVEKGGGRVHDLVEAAGALHGDMDQTSRMETLDKFRNGEIMLLAASDVAARGLDIPDVSHVFNYDTPHHAEDYVHRIGRTGRHALCRSRSLGRFPPRSGRVGTYLHRHRKTVLLLFPP